mgnify:CR=1 FL=1
MSENEQKKIIRVLVKEPYKEPYLKEIEDTLENLQEIVGGYIECVEMPGMRNVDLYVNEEGKLDRQTGNFWLPEYEDCVVGTCYMVGYEPEEGESIDITDRQIKECEKYIKAYELPKGMDLYNDFYILEALP